MPCTPARARMLKKGKAIARWSKLGVFYLKLKCAVEPKDQVLAVGVDPGRRFEAVSVAGSKDTVLNIMLEAVDWVKEALKQRRQMRRFRRYRKTRRRPYRCNNRLRNQRKGLPPPSTKARWDANRIIPQLKKVIPISHAVVEDVKAVTRRACRKWNGSFSPIEVGRQYFYAMLKAIGLNAEVKSGNETKLRDSLGLKKIRSKSEPVFLLFESQCVGSWCLAAMAAGAKHPTTRGLYYMVPLRWHRRLNRMEPGKNWSKEKKIRRNYLPWTKEGNFGKTYKIWLYYIGGN